MKESLDTNREIVMRAIEEATDSRRMTESEYVEFLKDLLSEIQILLDAAE